MKTYSDIHKIVREFYELATNDFLIGYHFRVIKDFEEHIPRIASFWENLILGQVTYPEHFPFRLLAKHLPLNIKRGELDRWILLFFSVLDKNEKEHPEWQAQSELWRKHIMTLKEKFLHHPSMFRA